MIFGSDPFVVKIAWSLLTLLYTCSKMLKSCEIVSNSLQICRGKCFCFLGSFKLAKISDIHRMPHCIAKNTNEMFPKVEELTPSSTQDHLLLEN